MELGLGEAIEALREELEQLIVQPGTPQITFPVEGATFEFKVGIRREGKVEAKVKVWVVEAGASATLASDETHTISVRLGPPSGRTGGTVRIQRKLEERP